MKSRLQQAGLWRQEDHQANIDIILAWRVLSRLGFPARYGGRSLDGLHEYIIVDPATSGILATGRGETLAIAICQAALNVRLSPNHHHPPDPEPGVGATHYAMAPQPELERKNR